MTRATERDPSPVICHTPTPGRKPTRIARWKYDAVRDAILSVVPPRAPGVAFRDLPELVRGRLSPDVLADLGSVGWYTTTVKLAMECDGELTRVPDMRPQHLVRML